MVALVVLLSVRGLSSVCRQWGRSSDEVGLLNAEQIRRWPLLVVQWMFAWFIFCSEQIVGSGSTGNGYTMHTTFTHGFQSGSEIGIWLVGSHLSRVPILRRHS
jgi:hypothetical protein